MTTKHTTTPWHVSANAPAIVRDAGGADVAKAFADTGCAAENAAFIVRACNAHSDLVAALKRLVLIEERGEDFIGKADLAVARAALAKARA